MTLLAVRDLTAGYGDADIIHGVSLDVPEGGIVTLIGPNGAGKSTVQKAIVGLLRPRAGSILFDGREIAGWDAEDVVAAGVGYVPQVANVFPTLTVREHFALAPQGESETLDWVLDLFPQLVPRLARSAAILSGGERQMLALARALMLRPRLMLMDEPSAALAPTVVQSVFERITAIAAAGIAVLLVEQNVKAALPISQVAYALHLGRNIMSAPGAELLEDPRLHDIYLGKACTVGAD